MTTSGVVRDELRGDLLSASIRTVTWQLAHGWVLDSGSLSASAVWVRV